MSGSADVPSGLPPRYKVEKELGRGGMGRVVAAFDTTIRRRVAIKIAPAPPPGDLEQQQAFQRFRREAQLAGGLRHESIVGIYDFGADDQSAWMVMEIVEGGSLRELLQKTETLSLAEIARIMVQLLDGLAFCHDQGIVHLDVKPANIMLTEPTTAGEVKLADFGIARNFGQPSPPHADDGEATRVFTASRPEAEAERIGTPAYMAPEQFSGGPLDARTDIWAAGVLLYHLLTRENPFKGDPDTIEMKVLNAEPTPPSQLSVLANRAFDDLVKKALAKRPADRFQDARAFTSALLEATRRRAAGRTSAPEPTVSTPPPSPPPAGSPAWLKFAAAGGGVAVLAGLAAFLLMPAAPPPPAPTQLAQPAPAVRPEAPTAPSALALLPAPAPVVTPAPVTVPGPTLSPALSPAPGQVAAPQLAAPQLAAPQPAPVPQPAPIPQLLLVPAQPLPAQPLPTQPLPAQALPAQTLPAQTLPAQTLPAQAQPVPSLAVPVPAPSPAPVMPSETVIQAALASAADRQRCALTDLRREGRFVTINGFVHQSEVGSLQQPLIAAGLAPRFQAETFDAPFCGILAALRPDMATQAGPRVAARTVHLRGGERLTLDFDMANWPAVVNLWFVMHDGTTLQLLANQRMAAGERRTMNQTSPDFPWLIGEPFGHEMIIMLASDAAPFATPRPLEETIDTLSGALGEAIRRAPTEGRRLATQAVIIHTRP